ncbi:MAG: DUF3791 domain-containing protein [Prevotellaceae bacterium]|jgi:hypothetical protein|nr:DUF3791 domain-containing protein [Prevotellaceae bacterium]
METKGKIEEAIMPFKVQQLVEIIMETKNIGFTDALHYLYSSDFYPELLSEDTKWWYSSGYELCDIIEEEKTAQQDLRKNRKLTLFFIFCIEGYKNFSGQPAETVLTTFSTQKVFAFLNKNYDALHTQDKSYIIETIDDYLKNI